MKTLNAVAMVIVILATILMALIFVIHIGLSVTGQDPMSYAEFAVRLLVIGMGVTYIALFYPRRK